ncbi:hypothetical protein F0562_026395 [Nyssa sinensis]|uniref:WRKY domain-containing protein n=1 Tax=Nyssa sinensis TaxID=561372 RepID=A0A5J5B942_9ASTE|nr:hypothetical protein F0562_026395 [Nyssa sinensis]
MDETISSMIKNGCKLAKDLELNLPYLANLQPNILSKSCDEIASMFINARDRLNALAVYHDQPREVQEWLRYGCTRAMDLLNAQVAVAAGKSAVDMQGVPENMGGSQWRPPGLQVVPVQDSLRLRGNRLEIQPMDVSNSGEGSSSQRTRRRRDDAERRTELVPAPQIGNTEIPPEDGFTWRKGYYRCTHQKLYQCQAKKQVQRLDNDPFVYEVTYRGNHTCHMSSTAPSIPPPSTEITQDQMTPQTTTTTAQPPPASIPLGTWLSMDIKPTGEGTSFIMDSHLQMYRDQFGLSGAGTSSSSTVSSAGAGPSTVRYGRDVDYQLPVVDLADAMFNSGSSSNSMDVIFSSMEDKWEGGDKKN